MARYKIELDREKCIGAAVCAAIAPQIWEMVKDGKVDLIGSKKNEETGMWELIVEDDNLNINIEAAQGCPITVIFITDLDTGKRLVG